MQRIMGLMFSAVFVSAFWMSGGGPGATPPPAPQGSGCCSNHQGVCGCSGGRAVCCDNTFSPSCGC
jgi:hypothetical protein